MEQRDKLLEVFNRCNVLLDNSRLAIPDFIMPNIEFLAKGLSEENSRMLVLHPGTDLLTVLSTVLLALYCIQADDNSVVETITTLSPGHSVIYEKSRGLFEGFDEEKRAVIRQSNGLICRVPAKCFYKIKPYYGKAKSLDGRGVSDKYIQRRKFISRIFGVNEFEVPSQIGFSFIIVCDRNAADNIISNVLIGHEKEQMKLQDIVPAAYYTPNEETHYAGNSSKAEPVLKFTSKVSVARQLVLRDKKKSILGLMIIGSKVLENGLSEVNNLLGRKSLKNVTILSEINRGDYRTLLENTPEMKLLAWTNNAIRNYYNLENYSMSEGLVSGYLSRSDNYLQEPNFVLLGSPISSKEYHIVRRILYKQMGNNPSSEAEDFIRDAYYLLKLFTNSILPLETYENQRGSVLGSPKIILDRLSKVAASNDDMNQVYTILMKFYQNLLGYNPKSRFIRNKIASPRSTKLAIICSKSYYKSVLHPACRNPNKILFYTDSNFSVDEQYEEVIFVSSRPKRNNPFQCNAAKKVTIPIYEFETQTYDNMRRDYLQLTRYYDEKNHLSYNFNRDKIDIPKSDELETSIDDFISNVTMDRVINQAAYLGQASYGNDTEVRRVALLDSGDYVLLTKHYTPYIFDALNETVTEAEVDSLEVGDILVFANKDGGTQGIVNEILKRVMSNQSTEKVLLEAYKKSIHWKTVLQQYIDEHTWSYRELSRIMGEKGSSKHEVTIRTWLTNDSHIVGPRDVKSFEIIAQITKDPDMLRNPREFYDACKMIRSFKIRILKYLGMRIINSLDSSRQDTDSLLEQFMSDTEDSVLTFKIEQLKDAQNLKVSVHAVNKPLSQI